jgi:hypothetical protein
MGNTNSPCLRGSAVDVTEIWITWETLGLLEYDITPERTPLIANNSKAPSRGTRGYTIHEHTVPDAIMASAQSPTRHLRSKLLSRLGYCIAPCLLVKEGRLSPIEIDGVDMITGVSQAYIYLPTYLPIVQVKVHAILNIIGWRPTCR